MANMCGRHPTSPSGRRWYKGPPLPNPFYLSGEGGRRDVGASTMAQCGSRGSSESPRWPPRWP
eukprot:9497740-Pyramimonas_sp.AAC.2